ncbi:class I SAM-dependent methyltransferase [Bacillus sp. AK031]
MMKHEQLFTGTALFYAKYRHPYPKELFDKIIDVYEPDSTGMLLDIGCGTGEIAVPLAPNFKNVMGLDINSGMLSAAASRAEEALVSNIAWRLAAAEELDNLPGDFDLITAGNSFHWMDRADVLRKSYQKLKDGGGMAILAGGSVWSGDSEWQNKTVEVIQRYLGVDRRAGNGTYLNEKRHEEYIAESAFFLAEEYEVSSKITRTIEDIIGYLFSTSFSKADLFGDRVNEFQEELAEELIVLNPEGLFEEKMDITCFFLKKR